MSAIWGAVSFDGRTLTRGLGETLEKPFHRCTIDRFYTHQDTGVVMGCGLQFFTAESYNEQFPIIDDDAIFTADAVVDNRQELLTALGLGKDDGSLGDGNILFRMFQKYGSECLNQLLGSYAFAYFDKSPNTVYLVSDVTCSRSLYYTLKDGILYFSTLTGPLLNAAGPRKINERWFTDFVALNNLALQSEFEETPYDNILSLAPGQIVMIKDGQIEANRYWTPDLTRMQMGSDEAYAEQFRALFEESVRCTLRDKNPAMLLSGGFDSSAVACYAARMARDRGERLRTFTSVPKSDFKAVNSFHFTLDESEKVRETSAYLEADGCKIENHFLSLEESNPWDGRINEMEMMEMPYKSLPNLLWMVQSMKDAYAGGNRIMLNGGYGNVTISAGGIDDYLNELLDKGKILTFLRQYHLFSRNVHRRKKLEASELVKFLHSHYLVKKPDLSDERLIGKAFIKKTALQKHHVKPRFAENAWKIWGTKSGDLESWRWTTDMVFVQTGTAATKHSLYTGVILRDPTMDKRLIEFCLRLPPDQFARDGVSRRLVRIYLADLIPEHIIGNNNHGIQSADAMHRLLPHWNRIRQELREIFERNRTSNIVDCERALAAVDAMEDPVEQKSFDVLRLCYTAMALEFMEMAPSNNSVRVVDGTEHKSL